MNAFIENSEAQTDIFPFIGEFVLLFTFEVLKHNRLCHSVDFLLTVHIIFPIIQHDILMSLTNGHFIADKFSKNTSLIFGYINILVFFFWGEGT